MNEFFSNDDNFCYAEGYPQDNGGRLFVEDALEWLNDLEKDGEDITEYQTVISILKIAKESDIDTIIF